MNSILRPTRPSTSDASPRVVDCNLQRLLEHDLCISLHGIGDIFKDICLQTDERSWTPHAVHKHAAFTTMFSCSIVSSLSLFAYLLLPHPCEACSERYQRHWAWNPRFLPLSNKPHETKIKTGKSGGVCLVVVDAAVLIFGELGYILINSGVSCAVKKRVCWTFVCDEFHT